MVIDFVFTMSAFTQQKIAALREQVLAYRNGPKKQVPDRLVDIDFKVLQDAVNSLELPKEEPVIEDWRRREVDDKMDFNHLTDESRDIITASLVYSNVVDQFKRERAANGDPSFPDRLTQCFQSVYEEYHCNGLAGDDLFDSLSLDIENRIQRRKARPAAYAILAHLFELCRIFEK